MPEAGRRCNLASWQSQPHRKTSCTKEGMMRLENQVALVTGSATGIGRATAIALAMEGADVIVNYAKSKAEAEETAAAVDRLGRKAMVVRADVSDDRQVRAMVDEAVNAFGRLDILVNNAGTTTFVPFQDLEGLTDEIWDREMSVNLRGTFYCSRAGGRVMQRQGRGCIVNVASDSGIKPYGSSLAYCASKAGVISLTATMAIALAPQVRVNAVAPGLIDTPWHKDRPDWRPRIEETALLRRHGKPEDVAEVIVALAASAGFVTGQVILVDGGQQTP